MIDPSKTRDMKVHFQIADDKRSFRFAIENPEPLSQKTWAKFLVGCAIGLAEKHGLTSGDIKEVFDNVNRPRMLV